MDENNVSWRTELANLVALAKTPEEQEAVNAFASALGPYLDKPELLRTLLGKIQRYMPAGAVNIIAEQGEFKDLDAVRAKLPGNVNVVVL
jgi:hypothetical protein